MKYAIIAIMAFMITLSGCNEEKLTGKDKLYADLQAAKDNLYKWKSEVNALEIKIAELYPDSSGIKRKLVTTMPVALETFNHYIEFQGTAKSEDNILISSDMGGLVTRILVDEGQNVSRGQTLIQLDNSGVLDNIEELKTSLELSNIVYVKQENLWSQKIGSEIQYLQAKNNKESLERKLQSAATQLEKTKIKSPINGTVDELFIKLGEMASRGAPSVRVVNNRVIEIEADVSEAHVGTIKKGVEVMVSFPALNLERKATIKSVGQIINPNNRTFKILLSISNKDNILKPNLLATIKIKDYSKENAIIVPTRLIHHARGDEFVYVANKNKKNESFADKILIHTGKTYKGNTEVLSGLSADQVLINDGYRDVTPGEIITFNNPGKN